MTSPLPHRPLYWSGANTSPQALACDSTGDHPLSPQVVLCTQPAQLHTRAPFPPHSATWSQKWCYLMHARSSDTLIKKWESSLTGFTVTLLPWDLVQPPQEEQRAHETQRWATRCQKCPCHSPPALFIWASFPSPVSALGVTHSFSGGFLDFLQIVLRQAFQICWNLRAYIAWVQPEGLAVVIS